MIKEYLDRIEKAYLRILQSKKPVDKSMTLWLGLYGLLLREDGTMEWISRKEPEPGPILELSLSQAYVPMYQGQLVSGICSLSEQINLASANAYQTQMQTIMAGTILQNAMSSMSAYSCGCPGGDGRQGREWLRL